MIELINVNKRFKNKVLFENVSLKIDKPGIYSFIGDNGVGKTTLLNIINKSIKANKGKVINKIKKKCFVSQSVNLIKHLTVKEHFELFCLDFRLLKRVNLYSKLNSYPSELSFGQRQRINCLISLYINSSLLIIDEPTSHLDEKNSELMMKEIKKVSRDKIVLLVSHHIDLVNEYSDAIYKIENNEVKLIKDNNSVGSILNKKAKFRFKRYINKNIRKYKKDNLLFSFIVFIMCFLVLLSNSVSSSIKRIINEEILYSLDYNKFYLKQCDEVKKENFVVKKCSNLSEYKLEILSSKYKVGLNYDVLMNTLYKSNKFSVVSNKNITLYEGRYPLKYNEIITNENYKIGDIITLKANEIISFDKTDIYNETLDLVVVGNIKNKHLFNEDKYYIDFDLLEEHLKEKQLINNGINLYSYFKWVDVENYKYVVYFDDIDIDVLKRNNIEYLSSQYDYYKNLEKIEIEIANCFKYLSYLVVPTCFYYFIRLLNKKIKYREKEINFLISNCINKKKVVKLISKEQRKLIGFCYFICVVLVTIINSMIFKESGFSSLIYLAYFIIICLVNYLLTKLFLSRRIRVC